MGFAHSLPDVQARTLSDFPCSQGTPKCSCRALRPRPDLSAYCAVSAITIHSRQEIFCPDEAGATSISRSGSVRSEQRSLGEKDLPPNGLRRIWPVASLLVGYSPRAGDAPSSRLATGQIGRNERHRIYASDHLGTIPNDQ